MRFLLTLILIYLVLRLIARIVFPLLLRMFVNNVQEQMHNAGGRNQQYKNTTNSNKKEGETNIHTSTNHGKISTSNYDNQGDYVDFEEVK